MTNMLDPNHAHELTTSGISDDVIASCGFCSTSSDELQRLLGWDFPPTGRGWVVPHCGPAGDVLTYTIKLDAPRTKSKDGQHVPIKYEAPKGSRTRLFIPPGVRDQLIDPTQLAVATEGVKKAAAGCSHGFAVIGLSGVWNWRGRDEEGKSTASLHEDFDKIPLAGRTVVIAFDSDAATNSNVQKAERALAAALRDRGALAIVVRLPSRADGRKNGLDDYLVSHGAEGFQRLIDAATTGTLVPAVLAVEEDEPSELELAQDYLARKCTINAEHTLQRYRGEFHHYKDNCYRPLSNEVLESWIFRELMTSLPAKRVNARLVRRILDCLRNLQHLGDRREQPYWIDDEHSPGPERSLVVMRNGILDLEMAFAGEQDCLRPHTPRFFSPTCLTYAFDPLADCPRWLQFLGQVLMEAECINLLQEWFGYLLLPDTSQQKFLILFGEGANGKTVVLEVLRALLGDDNVSAVMLEAFGQRFGLMPMIGKLANIVTEIGEVDRVAEGVLKSIVSGDPLTLDRKHREPILVRLVARLVYSTNTLPRFTDRSQGIWRRLMVVPFNVRIDEARQNRRLTAELNEELPGIFNWAMVGLRRLRTNNRFTHSPLSSQAGKVYELECNPTRQFLLDHYVCLPGKSVTSDSLRAEYSNWCQRNGHQALSASNLGREVRRAFPLVDRRRAGGRWDRSYEYSGLAEICTLPPAQRLLLESGDQIGGALTIPDSTVAGS